MNLPSGITEEQFLAAVKRVGGVLASKFSFGSHEPEDIRSTLDRERLLDLAASLAPVSNTTL